MYLRSCYEYRHFVGREIKKKKINGLFDEFLMGAASIYNSFAGHDQQKYFAVSDIFIYLPNITFELCELHRKIYSYSVCIANCLLPMKET